MQPHSGNQRPDLLTALINMSLVLRLPRKMHLCRSSSIVPRLASFLEMLQIPRVLLTFDTPWSLSPNLQRHLKQFLRKWHLQVLAYQVPCHNPSFKMVFIKHAAVLDQFCSHKQAIADGSTGDAPPCQSSPRQPSTRQTHTGS